MSLLLERPWILAPLTAALCGAMLFVNRRICGFLPEDPPSPGRKQHRRRTPLLGLALLPGACFVAWQEGDACLLGAFVLATATGLVDDWHKDRGQDFGWRPKAALLGLSAALLARDAVDPIAAPAAFAAALALAFVVQNAVNFLDNANGVACLLVACILLPGSAVEGPFWPLGWLALGFLPWNWPRARAFLGDGGAYLLGCMMAAFALQGGPTWAGLLPLAVPLLDFVQVVLVRLWLGLPPWRGDRRHITHILQSLGVPSWLLGPLLGAACAAAALLARGS